MVGMKPKIYATKKYGQSKRACTGQAKKLRAAPAMRPSTILFRLANFSPNSACCARSGQLV